jgi:peptidoglycan/LPS O-acetylase OafA/YrhL
MTIGWPGLAVSPIEGAFSRATASERNAGLDALRAAMVLLVVFHHAAVTYSGVGSWFYLEAAPAGSLTHKLFTILLATDQAYFMGLLFLLAGYFTPQSLDRHGTPGYIKERLTRLGIPLLVFGFLIGPMTIALAQTAKGHAFLPTLVLVWGRHPFESGPLWFVLALLIFSAVYLAWRRLAPAASDRAPSRFPSNLTLTVAALVTGAVAFALRLVWPVGTTVFNLQLGYFASYVVLFAAGCIGARSRWLDHVPARQRRTWLIVMAISLAVLAVKMLLEAPGVASQAGAPVTHAESSEGGWSVSAALYAFWEPLVAWGAILGLVHLFRRLFPKLGPTWTALARRSYTIFIIHPPVLVAVALAVRDVPAPPLVKFAITGTAACLACFWIAGGLLRIPGVRRVL